jgi:hypothetical protein
VAVIKVILLAAVGSLIPAVAECAIVVGSPNTAESLGGVSSLSWSYNAGAASSQKMLAVTVSFEYPLSGNIAINTVKFGSSVMAEATSQTIQNGTAGQRLYTGVWYLPNAAGTDTVSISLNGTLQANNTIIGGALWMDGVMPYAANVSGNSGGANNSTNVSVSVGDPGSGATEFLLVDVGGSGLPRTLTPGGGQTPFSTTLGLLTNSSAISGYELVSGGTFPHTQSYSASPTTGGFSRSLGISIGVFEGYIPEPATVALALASTVMILSLRQRQA